MGESLRLPSKRSQGFSPSVRLISTFCLSMSTSLGLVGCSQSLAPLFERVQQALKGRVSAPRASNQESSQAALALGERLAEAWAVVWMRPRTDWPVLDFKRWYGQLEQGGSLEGIVQGWMLSPVYRDLERGSAAGARSVTVAVSELERLASASNEVPEWALRDGLLQRVRSHEAANGMSGAARAVADGAETTWKTPLIGVSAFTLKRLLTEAALYEWERRRLSSRHAAAQWYGNWASEWSARAAELGVKFGLEARHRAEATFHERFGNEANEDQVRWEIVNRVHRLINQSEGRATIP